MFKFVRAAFCAALALASVACYSIPSSKSLYENVLPAQYVLKKSTAPIDTASLKTKKLVLIPSENFNAMAKVHAEYYEGGGLADARALTAPLTALTVLAGENFDNDRLLVKAHDPRTFADQVVASLTPYFASIDSAPDLASARDKGADVYGVIDYYGNVPPGVNIQLQSSWRGQSNLTLLDADLVEFVAVSGDSTRPFEYGLLFGSGIAVEAATYTKVMQDNIDQIRAGLRARLGPPV